MRFTIEQVFLTDVGGKPLGDRPATAYHRVEAESLDAALSAFLADQQATLIGAIQKFPGTQALATARQSQTLFTIHVMPGSDAFRAAPRTSSETCDEEKRPR
jgi:hypothetical protein